MPLSDFFLATTKAISTIDASGVPKSLPRFQTKGFDVVPLQKLSEMLRVNDDGVDPGDPLVHGDDYEWFVLAVTDDLAAAIASLSDADTKKHGTAIARIDELHWPATDGVKVLMELRELAKHVKAGTRLHVWVST